MSSAYMSLRTLASTLDMSQKAVVDYVARGMLPQPHRIGDEERWAWSEVDSWIKQSQSGTVDDDPFLRALRDGQEAEAPATYSHHAEPDGQTVHLLPKVPGHRKGRTPDTVA